MQIHSLRTFYWVTRLSSFRRAAEVLNVSQPTVSARIRGLEEELGVQLLERDHGLALTEQGKELLDYARKVLSLTEDLSFARHSPLLESRLRIGANGPVAATWLMTLVEWIEEEFPDLRIEIEVNQSSTLLRHLATRQLQVAFVSTHPRDPGVRVDQIGAYPMTWAGKPGVFPIRMTSEDLGRQPIVGYSWDSPVTNDTHEPAFGPGRHRRFTQSDSLFMLIRLAADGAGMILVPEAAIARELELGLLVRIELDSSPGEIPIFCARLNGRNRLPVTRTVQMAQKLMQEMRSRL